MATTARGTFEITMHPQPGKADFGGEAIAGQDFAKTFTGDIEGSSVGQMLASVSATPGSAAYVAIELVRAHLAGLDGTFVLQQTGVLDRGQESLDVTIVPDSGTAGLTGISGSLSIERDGGEHFYELVYELAQPT